MTKKRIAFGIVAVVIIVVMIVGNYILNLYSGLLHQVFAGDTTDYSGAQSELAEGDELVQDLAEDSIVLLKNEDNFLPLEGVAKVNLFGWAATDQGFCLVGGGSGGTVVASENKVTLTDAFEREDIEYNNALLQAYSAVSSTDADKNSTSANSTAVLANPPSSFYTSDRMTEAKEFSNTAVVVLARFSGENASQSKLVEVGSYKNGTYLELMPNEKAMLDALEQYGFDVVVLFNTCNNMEMGFLDEYDNIKAALYVGILGQSGALAIPRILKGLSPSGKTTDTYAYDYQTNNPTYANNMYKSNSIAYGEGIYLGYKWYETADAEGFFTANGTSYDEVVQFPFGYGLSYSEFEWTLKSTNWSSNETMSESKTYTMQVTVKNIGDYPAKEVVQLYFTPPYTEGGIEKAHVNLVDFAKTRLLEVGDSQTVELKFTAYDLASYDAYDKNENGFSGYEVEEGNYLLKLMANAHEFANVNGGDNEIALGCNGLIIENDPVTGEKVENRFTGDTAYADLPVDGEGSISGGVNYLSRANSFANYTTQRAATASVSDNKSNYRYDGYDNEDVSSYMYGVDSGYRLVYAEDEDKMLTNPTLKQLNGEDESVKNGSIKLVPDEELMETLSNYEAEEWEILLNQLTVAEIKDLIGRGGFQTVALESVGKPRCVDRDGPAGFNLGVTNTETETKWTAYPAEAILGCSWNTELMYQMGISQGKTALATGLQGWYAPCINLHRSVYNTRNFESFSEDGVLSGDLAAMYVKGAKENDLYCYVKHFVNSEAGANPNNKNTWLTEQTLRELYLKPFEIAVKEGGANAMMSSFNRVGGVWAGSNHALLTDVLRGEWGFRGSVITDWADMTYMDYTRGVLAGNDLWLAGGSSSAANIDMNNPAIAYRARLAAKNILYTYVSTITTVAVTAAPQSALFSGLWIAINVILSAGILACIICMFERKKRNDDNEDLAVARFERVRVRPVDEDIVDEDFDVRADEEWGSE